MSHSKLRHFAKTKPQQNPSLSSHQQSYLILPPHAYNGDDHDINISSSSSSNQQSQQGDDHHRRNLKIFHCFNNLSLKKSNLFKVKGGGLLSSFMASHGDISVHSPSEIRRKKKQGGQQKREELEKEVYNLQKMLNRDEKVHTILEHVDQRNDHSVVGIPSFLPPKAKELLAELAMVEDEIARLEGQINTIQVEIKREKELTKETKTRHALMLPILNPMNKEVHEKMGFETKALHFISKAIKGDYNLNVFSVHESVGKFGVFGDQKENNFREDDNTGLLEKSSRRSRLKPSSPLRDPRQPTPKREREIKVSFELPPKSTPSPTQSIPEETNFQNSQPNKLSENIMKCLTFIYVRLLRTSRAMELEKSSAVSRSSTHVSVASRSFRVVESNNLTLQKDSRQQDPYGIFISEESLPRDIGPYKNLVKFTSSSLDLRSLSSASFIPLLQNLRVLLNQLQKVGLELLSHQQKLAFWINMYNACIMHGYLQYGVPSSPEKLLTLMNKATLNIGGNMINAQAIEHFILRKRPSSSGTKEIDHMSSMGDKESIVRELYGLESMDPNIIFAFCCGTRSSPAVKIYTPEAIMVELERSKLEYLQASIIVTTTKKLAFPELLLRNMHDFADNAESFVKWVCHQLPTSGSLRKSMVDCIRKHNNGKLSMIVEKITYDFEFQYLLAF